MMQHRLGLIYALAAYTWWGIQPIFWKQLAHIGAIEILTHRMVWSSAFAVIIIMIMRDWLRFSTLFKQPQLIARLFIASLLVSFNWSVFIWAINEGHLVETSMGYFINPLINVLFGVILFKENLRRTQIFALLIMACAILYLIIAHGSFPWIALSLALSFALYSVVKKTLQVPALHGIAIETLLIMPFALAYLVYLQHQQHTTFGMDINTNLLLILGGLITLIPLLLFASAAKRVSMTVLGMTQYIGPSLQLIIGIFLYQETFGQAQAISFGLIWLALIIYSVDQLSHLQRRKINKSQAATP